MVNQEAGPRPPLQWRRILAEGTAIVVSILLAFGIEAWWSDLQDRGEERELLSSLYDELEANQISLAQNIRTVEAGLHSLRALLAVRPPEMPTIPPDSVYDRLITPFRRTFTSELAVGALNSTMSSGKLALIRNANIRSGLAQYQARIADVSELSAALADLSVDATTALGGYPQLTQAIATQGPREVEVSAGTLTAIVSDPHLMGLVSVKAYLWSAYIREQASILEAAEGVQVMIASELGLSESVALAP